MALSAFVIQAATQHSITYTVTEDGNAVDAVSRTVADLLAGSQLAALLSPAAAVANQAAARTLLESLCDVRIYSRASTTAGATAHPLLMLDANINGGAPANFEFDFSGVKAANADTATHIVQISVRHSLVA